MMNGEKKKWRVVFYDFSEIQVIARTEEDAKTLARAERIIADLPSSVRRAEEMVY